MQVLAPGKAIWPGARPTGESDATGTDRPQKGKDASYRQKAGQIVYEAMVAHTGVPKNDRFQIIAEHSADNFIFDPDYLGIHRTSDLIMVQIFFNEGRSVAQKQALYKAIADGLSEQLGVRREDVFITLVDVKKENWSFGNGIAQYALMMKCGPMQAAVEPAKSPLGRYRAMLVLICVSAPSFMLQLDANIVAVSLPSISESLRANFAGIEWVVTAYTLSFASLLLPAGALADRFGRKRVLMAGLVIFTVASFFCGAAPDLTTLVTARAFQGIGAALQFSAALATLSSFFKGDERARAFAFWGTVVGIGIAMGPIVGGLITQTFGWQWAFYINLPIGALTIALVAVVIEDSRDPGRGAL